MMCRLQMGDDGWQAWGLTKAAFRRDFESILTEELSAAEAATALAAFPNVDCSI